MSLTQAHITCTCTVGQVKSLRLAPSWNGNETAPRSDLLGTGHGTDERRTGQVYGEIHLVTDGTIVRLMGGGGGGGVERSQREERGQEQKERGKKYRGVCVCVCAREHWTEARLHT